MTLSPFAVDPATAVGTYFFVLIGGFVIVRMWSAAFFRSKFNAQKEHKNLEVR